jgi:hypothetical protein
VRWVCRHFGGAAWWLFCVGLEIEVCGLSREILGCSSAVIYLDHRSFGVGILEIVERIRFWNHNFEDAVRFHGDRPRDMALCGFFLTQEVDLLLHATRPAVSEELCSDIISASARFPFDHL